MLQSLCHTVGIWIFNLNQISGFEFDASRDTYCLTIEKKRIQTNLDVIHVSDVVFFVSVYV